MNPPKLPTISPAPPKGRIVRYPDGRIVKQTAEGITILSTTAPSLTIRLDPPK